MKTLDGETIGSATLTRRDGAVVVERADRLIRVTLDLLRSAAGWVWDPHSQVLQLDTAGEYRYRWTGQCTEHHLIFERIPA